MLLDLDHPIFAGAIEESITRLTPENLAPVLDLPHVLVGEVVTELVAASSEEDPTALDRRYWSPTRRLIHGKLGATAEPIAVELTRAIGRVMFRSLYQKPPNRSPVGRALLGHASGLVEAARGPQTYFVDPQTMAEIEANAGALRIKADLPAYHRMLGAVLERSAEALREHAEAKGCSALRLFRGVHGELTPESVDDVSARAYPMRALSSWSTTFARAESFASGRARGAVIEAIVPTGCFAMAPGGLEDELLIFPVDITGSGSTGSLHDLEIVAIHSSP